MPKPKKKVAAPRKFRPPKPEPATTQIVSDTPPPSPLPFPVVGIGASAGGIEALSRLMRAVSGDLGMAYVVVQHLDPTHESMLPDILGRATAMPVRSVSQGTAVERDAVYVIPPGMTMELTGRTLSLFRRDPKSKHMSVDLFLSSLAREQGHRAIGVILSGSGTDGTIGLQQIKAEGGITFAQDATAQQDSMPRTAVSAGVVDYVLPPEDIAAELARIARHPYVAPGGDAAAEREARDGALARVVETLRIGTDVDFSNYKRTTLYRRIVRRAVLHKLENLTDYVELLAKQPQEVDALFQDVLIGVTSFFRNPEAFEALKTAAFPSLTRTLSRHDPLRVWVMGCATGEEAYSLAMAFTEFAEATGGKGSIQIFATDLNGAGIEKARAGVYARGIARDVSPERLRRFFGEVDGSYRVVKPIREKVVFAQHNALAAPPFSHIDLVSCRNLLIYLDAVAQQRMVPLMHYALEPHGILWLGNSETIGTYRDLFDVVDARHRIYRRKPGPARVAVPLPASVTIAGRPRPHGARGPIEPIPGPDAHTEADRILLAKYAPPAVLVSAELDILQFRGDSGRYLSPAPGKASLNLLKMLREGLVAGVRSAIQRARKEGATVRETALRVRAHKDYRDVAIEITPIQRPHQDLTYLITFEDQESAVRLRERLHKAEEDATEERRARTADKPQREVARLKQELDATREYLQSVIEQQEAANEELQSANEEVQSASEELETVNDELQNRNLELSQANNDFTNLLASVNIAIVMIGHDLRIRRFTPIAEKMLNLSATDLGRPISDVKLPVAVTNLDKVVLEVIDSVTTWEREAQGPRGHWYSIRIRPYKTADNKIDGAVVVLVDVDSLKRSQEEARRQADLLAHSDEPILAYDVDGRLSYWNHAAEQTYGFAVDDALGKDVHELLNPDPPLASLLEGLRREGKWTGEVTHRRHDGQRIQVESRMALVRTPDQPDMIIEACREVTERKQLQAELHRQTGELRDQEKNRSDFLLTLAHELRSPLSALRNAVHILHAPGADATTVTRTTEAMTRQIRSMARMIDDLLDVSRIARGDVRIDHERVDVGGAIRSAVDANRERLSSRAQKLSVTLPPEPVYVTGDAMRLEQVFSNLIANASKFTNQGGQVWLTADTEPAHVVVRIRDDGVGIVPAVLPRVFDLFVQAQRAPDAEPGGLGLGLTLVRRVVELHGGSVAASNAGEGQGSEFVVRLPIANNK